MISANVQIEIPFHDVDVMDIAWHGHYAKYFELARCVLLDKIDYNYPQMRASGYAWPVVDLRIRYTHALRFQQQIKVMATLTEWENRMKIVYKIEDVASKKLLTTGYTIQVAVDMSTHTLLLASPDVLFDKLDVAR